MTEVDVRRIEDKVDNVALVLAELRGSLSPTLDKLTKGQEDLGEQIKEDKKDTDDRLNDHEERLRASERFRFAFPSLAVLALLLDGALGFYLIAHGG